MAGASKTKRILKWVSWGIFSLLSGLIVLEAATPADNSSLQSGFLAKTVAGFINLVTPGEEAEPINPSGITFQVADPIQDEHEAILGAIRRVPYVLDSTDPNALLSSGVSLAREDGSTDKDYQLSLFPGAKGGSIEILSYKEKEDCSFSLTDAGGHKSTYTFSINKRKAPTSFAFCCPTLEIGQAIPLEGTLGEDDHHLREFYDPSKITFTSSNASIFSIDSEHHLLKAEAAGKADLLLNGTKIWTVEVKDSTYESVTSFSVNGEKVAHTNDYFYDGLGNQLTATSNLENELYVYEIEDDLKARISSDHYKQKEDGSLTLIRGGLLEGYRKDGSTKLVCYPASNPSLKQEFAIENTPETNVSSFEFQLSVNGKAISPGTEVDSGSKIKIEANYAPLNLVNHRFKATSSDSEVLLVEQAEGESILVSAKGKGKATLHLESSQDPSFFQDIELSVKLLPTIDEKEQEEIGGFLRKAVGHFGLFLFTATWGLLAFVLTLEDRKHPYLFSLLFAGFIGTALAFGSEGIQLIPSLHRSGEIRDAFIDLSGYVVGLFLCLLIYHLITLRKGKKEKKDD